MVTQATTRLWRTPHVATLVGLWWLESAAFALLSLQPFEPFLAAQAHTASLPAYNPFVLFVALQREQRALPSALGASGAWMLLGVLSSQVPLTLVLVSLCKRVTSRVTFLVSAATALPHVTTLSLLAHGVPLACVCLLNATVSARALLNASPTAWCVWGAVGLVLLAVWLVYATCLDVARVHVVLPRRSGSSLRALLRSLAVAARVVMQRPVRLCGASALTRVLGLASLGAALMYSMTVANAHPPTGWWVPWLVTQGAVLFGLGLRVAWFAHLAGQLHNLRPPSRNS